MSTMKGKTALVTGAGQGIGKAIAQAFLKAGARVVLAEIDGQAGPKAQRQLARWGKVEFVPCDTAVEDSVRACVAAAIRRFKRLDFVINNAGIGVGKPVEQLGLDEWNRVLGTNLTGIFLFAKYAAKHLRKAKGAIVNIASTRAFMSEADTEAYSASKGGVVSLTHALAISLGPAIRVNCISPRLDRCVRLEAGPAQERRSWCRSTLPPSRPGGSTRGHRRDGAVSLLAAERIHHRHQRHDRWRCDEEDDLPGDVAGSCGPAAAAAWQTKRRRDHARSGPMVPRGLLKGSPSERCHQHNEADDTGRQNDAADHVPPVRLPPQV